MYPKSGRNYISYDYFRHKVKKNHFFLHKKVTMNMVLLENIQNYLHSLMHEEINGRNK